MSTAVAQAQVTALKHTKQLLLTDGKSNILTQRLTDQSQIAKTIFVYNVSPKASEDNLRAFFGYCGKLKDLKQQYDRSKNEFCWAVEFERAEMARTACMLHTTPLLGSEIQIISKVHNVDALTEISKKPPPTAEDESSNSILALPAPPVAESAPQQILPAQPQDLSSLLFRLMANPANSVREISSEVPNLSEQQRSQLAANLGALLILQLGYDPHQPPDYLLSLEKSNPNDLVRTVHITGLPSIVSKEILVRHFSSCGPIAQCNIGGSAIQSFRFAFIEFLEIGGALAAIGFTNSMLLGGQLQVMRAHNSLNKAGPAATSTEKKDVEGQKEQQSTTKDSSGGKEKSKSRSSSRSSNGHHHHSHRHRHHRSRSRSHKHHHHHHKSRSRSKKHRKKSR